MNEDKSLNDFIKGRLEDGASEKPPRLDAILHAASEAAQSRAAARRSRMCVWGGLLAAASIAAICLFAIHLSTPATAPEQTIANAPATSETTPVTAPETVSEPDAELPTPEQTVVDAIELLSAVDGDELDVAEVSAPDILLAWQDAPYKDAVSELYSEN